MLTRDHIRSTTRNKRQAYSSSEQAQFADKLRQQLIVHQRVQSANSIAIYLANDGELATMPFIQWCWQHNKQVYLPVIHPFSKGHLLFLQYTSSTPLVENQFGITEPKLDVSKIMIASALDIIFTPLVAFDKQGNRLGMGGGFYDRTLAKFYHDSQTKPYSIGLAHDCQCIETIPTQDWDIPLPEIITPSQRYIFQ